MRDPKKSLNSLELFVKEDSKFKRLVKQSVAAHKLGISPFTLRAYLTRNQRPYRVFKTQIQNWLLEEEIDEDIQKRNENKKGL